MKAGVPQGSILSPLLFNIFMNDFPSTISNCTVFQYADDTILLSRSVGYKKAMNNLQRNVDKAMQWYSQKWYCRKRTKNKTGLLQKPFKDNSSWYSTFLHPHDCVSCHCSPVEYVNSIKYLGVLFDSDLSWQSHLAYVCNRLRSAACLLFNIKSMVPVAIKKNNCPGLAYSILRYGITVFASCGIRWQNRVDNLLKNILKSVAYNSSLLTGDNIFHDVSLPSFRSLFEQTVVTRQFWNPEF